MLTLWNRRIVERRHQWITSVFQCCSSCVSMICSTFSFLAPPMSTHPFRRIENQRSLPLQVNIVVRSPILCKGPIHYTAGRIIGLSQPSSNDFFSTLVFQTLAAIWAQKCRSLEFFSACEFPVKWFIRIFFYFLLLLCRKFLSVKLAIYRGRCYGRILHSFVPSSTKARDTTQWMQCRKFPPAKLSNFRGRYHHRI